LCVRASGRGRHGGVSVRALGLQRVGQGVLASRRCAGRGGLGHNVRVLRLSGRCSFLQTFAEWSAAESAASPARPALLESLCAILARPDTARATLSQIAEKEPVLWGRGVLQARKVTRHSHEASVKTMNTMWDLLRQRLLSELVQSPGATTTTPTPTLRKATLHDASTMPTGRLGVRTPWEKGRSLDWRCWRFVGGCNCLGMDGMIQESLWKQP